MTTSWNSWQLFCCFLKLGLSSFGGPVAHLGYFRTEFVERRRWLSEQHYAELVALCQFLPGPASSQVGMALGMLKAGYLGALAAWLGFTLPSALLLIGLALGLTQFGAAISGLDGLLHGLKIVAVAVVVQAVWGMAQSLCNSKAKLTLLALLLLLSVPLSVLGPLSQVAIILMGACAGLCWLRDKPAVIAATGPAQHSGISRRAAYCFAGLFVLLLLLLPLLRAATEMPLLALFDTFYRAGALVFGGGHVVLPLLQAEVVQSGQISPELFMAGYGVVQAAPGPLFTFAGYLGAAMPAGSSAAALLNAGVALVAVFLPGFLILCAAWPFWLQLRSHAAMQAALSGIGAAVVAILASALYQPVWTSTVKSPLDFALVVLAVVSLISWKCSPVWLVLAGAGVGWICW